MVWYGKVWDDKLDDWTYEDDGPSEKPKTAAERAKWFAETQAAHERSRLVKCKPLYGEGNHRPGEWRENSGYAWCAHCGYRYEREHTVIGACAVGTGGKVTSTGHECRECPKKHGDPWP